MCHIIYVWHTHLGEKKSYLYMQRRLYFCFFIFSDQIFALSQTLFTITNAHELRITHVIFYFRTNSPQKGLRTPTKTPTKTPVKTHSSVRDSAGKESTAQNDLMSPKKAVTPRCLFSPSESNSIPAYERYHQERTAKPLALPYKYQSLLKTFRYVDWVCSMFYNRKETITFDKLEPAVKRMMRKDFTQKHLAQIKYLDADAYTFDQRKMLNPGSHTKTERYRLIITPNIELSQANEAHTIRNMNDEDIVRNADAKTMNPKILITRFQRFQSILLDRVKHEHDLFLRSLPTPVIIPKEKIQRWHQDFELEACPDILTAELPQSPNIERFSSAKDILSTARNLFNHYDESKTAVSTPSMPSMETASPSEPPPPTPTMSAEDDARAKLLKNIPKALVCSRRRGQLPVIAAFLRLICLTTVTNQCQSIAFAARQNQGKTSSQTAGGDDPSSIPRGRGQQIRPLTRFGPIHSEHICDGEQTRHGIG